MMFTVVVLPNVEAALPVDVNKKCSLEISISSHSYAEDLSKNDVLFFLSGNSGKGFVGSS